MLNKLTGSFGSSSTSPPLSPIKSHLFGDHTPFAHRSKIEYGTHSELLTLESMYTRLNAQKWMKNCSQLITTEFGRFNSKNGFCIQSTNTSIDASL